MGGHLAARRGGTRRGPAARDRIRGHSGGHPAAFRDWRILPRSISHGWLRTRGTAGMVRPAARRESAPMTPLLEAARNLQDFFNQRSWRFCIIGGLALLRWGEPRFTRDVDVTLLCGFGREEDFINPLLASGYGGRISDAAGFALRNRVLPIESSGGVPIAVALGGLPFEEL